MQHASEGGNGGRWVAWAVGRPAAGRKAASDGEACEDMTVGRLPAEVNAVACPEYDGRVLATAMVSLHCTSARPSSLG